MEVSFDFAGEYAGFAGKDGIFFIVKFKKGTPEGGDNGWVGQSQNVEVKYEEKFEPDNTGHIDIWTIPGEGNAIEVYSCASDETASAGLAAVSADFGIRSSQTMLSLNLGRITSPLRTKTASLRV